MSVQPQSVRRLRLAANALIAKTLAPFLHDDNSRARRLLDDARARCARVATNCNVPLKSNAPNLASQRSSPPLDKRHSEAVVNATEPGSCSCRRKTLALLPSRFCSSHSWPCLVALKRRLAAAVAGLKLKRLQRREDVARRQARRNCSIEWGSWATPTG